MTKVKCHMCEKNLKLVLSIKGKCRCDNTYCSEHLMTHVCKFDYKNLQKQKLIQENPQVIADKLNHI